jgi:hypothetical protein
MLCEISNYPWGKVVYEFGSCKAQNTGVFKFHSLKHGGITHTPPDCVCVCVCNDRYSHEM